MGEAVTETLGGSLDIREVVGGKRACLAVGAQPWVLGRGSGFRA